MANIFGRQVVLPLTNKSGGQVIAGDVLIVDTTNDAAFTTTTSAGFTGGIGIAQETIASNATGRVLVEGYAALVNVVASVTRGQFGTTHTVAKQAIGTASRTVGTFCQWLTGGTTPTARVYPPDLNAASGAVATDAIWDAAGDLAVGSGADTAARLAKGSAGATLAMGNSAVIWNAGTSFPASKATNDRYWRTDLGMEGYWDGTRWLSSTLYTLDLVGPFDGQTTAVQNGWPVASGNSPINIGRKSIWHSDYALWLVNLYGDSFTSATNNGSNYWTLSISGAVTTTAYGSINTSADTASTHTGHVAAINAAAGSTERAINTLLTKTGTPGTTFFPALLTYRLILT